MNLIEQALKRTTDTKALILERGAMEKTATMFMELFPGKKGVVVADTRTFSIAGKRVDTIMAKAGLKVAEPFIFDDPDLFAEWGFVCRLKEYLSGIDAVAVAVGSGVINDLTKICVQYSRTSLHDSRDCCLDGRLHCLRSFYQHRR